MADIIHIEDVRNAARQLYRLLEHIDSDDALCTSDIIALSFWLIDFENLVSVKPVKRLSRLLIHSLQEGTFDHSTYRQVLATCSRCCSVPGSHFFSATPGRSKETASPQPPHFTTCRTHPGK